MTGTELQPLIQGVTAAYQDIKHTRFSSIFYCAFNICLGIFCTISAGCGNIIHIVVVKISN
jgi:hypothetical protein